MSSAIFCCRIHFEICRIHVVPMNCSTKSMNTSAKIWVRPIYNVELEFKRWVLICFPSILPSKKWIRLHIYEFCNIYMQNSFWLVQHSLYFAEYGSLFCEYGSHKVEYGVVLTNTSPTIVSPLFQNVESWYYQISDWWIIQGSPFTLVNYEGKKSSLIHTHTSHIHTPLPAPPTHTPLHIQMRTISTPFRLCVHHPDPNRHVLHSNQQAFIRLDQTGHLTTHRPPPPCSTFQPTSLYPSWPNRTYYTCAANLYTTWLLHTRHHFPLFYPQLHTWLLRASLVTMYLWDTKYLCVFLSPDQDDANGLML
jgi:hypothetical protein